jgi:predicted ArsR family transcriptional regulator
MREVVEALQAERAEVKEHLDWLDQQIATFRSRLQNGSSQRLRASDANDRNGTGDTRERIKAFLRGHAGSTAGEVAKGLDMNRNSVATRLTQMARAGEIQKAQRGYRVKG